MANTTGVSFITSFYSNIDIEEVVNKLMEIERKPVNMMKDRVNSLTTKKNEWSSLKSDLISLKSLVYSIKQITFWKQKIGYSSDENILKVRVDENALPTKYNITINSLATYSRREGGEDIALPIDPDALLNQAGYGEEIKYGYFTINGVQIEVNETDTTNTILTKINNQISGMNATYDSLNDKIVLTYEGNIIIGSPNDTSNFLEVAKLSSGQNTVQSSTKLGVLNLNATLENSRLKTTSSSSGTFKINGIEFSYDSTKDTLNKIITNINASNANVYAYYDSYMDRIVLLNKETGSNGIFVEDVTGNLMSALQLTTNSNLILGNNASYTVEGFNNNQPIQSKNNYNVKIASGVYVDFLNTGSANIKIENDIDKIISQIKSFIENYNNVFSKIREKNKVEIKGETIEKGSLQGETLLTDISINLRSKMNKIYNELPTGFTNLVDFGINSDIKGIYTIDETKLKNKIIENPEETKQFFTKLTTDIYSYLDTLTKEGYGIYGGVISNRINTIDNEINRLNKDIKTYEERLKLIEERYWTSFIGMEKMVSQLNSYLGGLYYFTGLNINEKR